MGAAENYTFIFRSVTLVPFRREELADMVPAKGPTGEREAWEVAGRVHTGLGGDLGHHPGPSPATPGCAFCMVAFISQLAKWRVAWSCH